MEKNRWSLIFIGLCLALAFSVSSVEAQLENCNKCGRCDRDGDREIKDTKPCQELCVGLELPTDLNDGDAGMCGDSDDGDPVEICNFKKFRKHCEDDGENWGGGVMTVIEFSKSYFRRLANGDCLEGSFTADIEETGCVGHCLALNVEDGFPYINMSCGTDGIAGNEGEQ